jgi:hypothetical protein
MLHRRKFLLLSLAAGVGFWLIDTTLDAKVFEVGAAWTEHLIPEDALEWWMRLLTVALIVSFGAYVDWAHRALLRAAEEHRVVVQSKLDDALTRVLDDFLPICSHCKAIRRGANWLPLESYVTGQTKSQFSHGLCPKCLPLYDDSA